MGDGLHNNKNILVTGGAGYIGSHTCKALRNAGYNPIAYDSLIYGHKDFVKWGLFEEGDILDKEKLAAVFEKHRPDAVIHFAAFAYVGESVEDPSKYYWNNVAGTLTLLDVMKKHGVKKIVFSSTCATYGYPLTVPISEKHSQNPINPYGQTKLTVEKILHDFDIAYGIKSISLRYFNAAGADPAAEVGEDHNPETHLVPLVLNAAAGFSENITVFGNDYDTPDGTCIRDYIHVSDLADAHVLALKKLEMKSRSDFFNLGNGSGYSVMEIIKTAENITNVKIPYNIGQRRAGDPDRLISNSTKAFEQLGWKPQFGDIEIIVKHAWQWHKKRFLYENP
jgi:UDP-glucose-4-epimerase GalE